MKFGSFKALATAAVMAVAAVSTPSLLMAATPATQPTTRPAKAPAAGMNNPKIARFITARNDVMKAVGNPAKLADADYRKKVAPDAIPALKEEMAAIDDLAGGPELPAAAVPSLKQTPMAQLYALGDQDTVTKVDAMATGTDTGEKSQASAIQLTANWMLAGTDTKKQSELADQVIAMDKANPSDASLTMLTYQFSQQTKDKALSEKLRTASVGMDNRTAQMIKMQAEAGKKLAALEGKPLTVTGKTVDGKDFSTADWKGKVILVDFWATWCGPCRAELPHVKEAYAKYHDKGFEIVGVSNDYSVGAVTKFTPANGMPWPELLDTAAAAQHQWNPTTLNYGIMGIPTMFLIDKNGVCRTVEARGHLDELVPQMLGEAAPTNSN